MKMTISFFFFQVHRAHGPLSFLELIFRFKTKLDKVNICKETKEQKCMIKMCYHILDPCGNLPTMNMVGGPTFTGA